MMVYLEDRAREKKEFWNRGRGDASPGWNGEWCPVDTLVCCVKKTVDGGTLKESYIIKYIGVG